MVYLKVIFTHFSLFYQCVAPLRASKKAFRKNRRVKSQIASNKLDPHSFGNPP